MQHSDTEVRDPLVLTTTTIKVIYNNNNNNNNNAYISCKCVHMHRMVQRNTY